MAGATLAVAFSPPRRQHPLPEKTHILPPRGAILSKGCRRRAGRGAEYYREGQQVEGLQTHVGFYDKSYAFKQDILWREQR